MPLSQDHFSTAISFIIVIFHHYYDILVCDRFFMSIEAIIFNIALPILIAIFFSGALLFWLIRRDAKYRYYQADIPFRTIINQKDSRPANLKSCREEGTIQPPPELTPSAVFDKSHFGFYPDGTISIINTKCYIHYKKADDGSINYIKLQSTEMLKEWEIIWYLKDNKEVFSPRLWSECLPDGGDGTDKYYQRSKRYIPTKFNSRRYAFLFEESDDPRVKSDLTTILSILIKYDGVELH
jgi:hypothetical protein